MKPPLFILAPGRSFTSVTCAMLGCHPQALGLAEINLFAGDTLADMQELYKTRQRLASGLLRTLAELAFGEQSEETIEAARRWLLDNQEMSTAELFRTMQEWAGDRMLIDKSPLHVFTPEALRRMGDRIPEAYYLHLTRHPGDTVDSVVQLQQKVRDRVRERARGLPQNLERFGKNAPNEFWLEPHLHILEFLETVPAEQHMRLRGEDLLSEPANYLRQIAEWLGIRTDDEAVEAMLHPENSPFSKYGPGNARFGNDPNFMEKPHLRPYTYKPRPLSWTPPDGTSQELSETVQAYAMILGY